MHPAEYMDTQDRLLAAALEISTLPLDEFLEAADRADAIGAVANPTLYRAGAENLRLIRDLARRCRAVQRLMTEHDSVLMPLAGMAASRRHSALIANPEGPH